MIFIKFFVIGPLVRAFINYFVISIARKKIKRGIKWTIIFHLINVLGFEWLDKFKKVEIVVPYKERWQVHKRHRVARNR